MKNIFLKFSLLFLLASCEKEEVVPETPPLSYIKTYVAGEERIPNTDYTRAKYWEGTTENYLASANTDSKAYGISVINNGSYNDGVFVAGYEREDGVMKARLWKNTAQQNLNKGDGRSFATGIFTTGNNVYCCGVDSNFAGNQAVCWFNGLQTFLTLEETNAYASSIYVDNNNVYVAGYIEQNGLKKAVYWKNNEPPVFLTITSNAAYNCSAEAIVVKNNKVYVGGNFKIVGDFPLELAVYWVNNQDYIAESFGKLTSIAVDDAGAVFTAGAVFRNGNPVAMLWKNNQNQNIIPTSTNSTINALFQTSKNLYKAGFGEGIKATYWSDNNNPKVLDAKTTYANSIYVIEY
jgi:hypothetical protein